MKRETLMIGASIALIALCTPLVASAQERPPYFKPFAEVDPAPTQSDDIHVARVVIVAPVETTISAVLLIDAQVSCNLQGTIKEANHAAGPVEGTRTTGGICPVTVDVNDGARARRLELKGRFRDAHGTWHELNLSRSGVKLGDVERIVLEVSASGDGVEASLVID